MKQTTKRLLLGLTGLSLIAVISLKANPVTVQEVGIGPNETVYITSTGPNPNELGVNLHVYAGVVDLKVNGVSTTGFCVDPWHWSGSGALSYNTVPLEDAPKPPGPMGANAAKQIEQLWGAYYTSGPVDNITAAALQIEIWKLVDLGVSSATFQLVSIDNDSTAVYAKIAEMANFLSAHPDAYRANLIAVTGSGQDYVISVPDGGTTVALLGLGLIGLLACRRKLLAS